MDVWSHISPITTANLNYMNYLSFPSLNMQYSVDLSLSNPHKSPCNAVSTNSFPLECIMYDSIVWCLLYTSKVTYQVFLASSLLVPFPFLNHWSVFFARVDFNTFPSSENHSISYLRPPRVGISMLPFIIKCIFWMRRMISVQVTELETHCTRNKLSTSVLPSK